MNCCDANGDCKGGPGCASRKRPCHELGVCQGDHRSPFAFAPGVIEGHKGKARWLGTPPQRQALMRWAAPVLAWLVFCTVCGLAVGLIVGRTS